MTTNQINPLSNEWTATKYGQLHQFLQMENEPRFRFTQITQAIFKHKIDRFEKMTVLPKRLRAKIIDRFGPSILEINPVVQTSSPQAEKVLFELPGGDKIETVAMKYRAGWESFCISSQSGCGFGCRFCATGRIGLKRNLTADEISDQILYFALRHRSLDSISFMGMGEALANPHLFAAIETLTDPQLFGLSQRRLTVSTIGIIPGIQKLTQRFPQINLTFSLHSPFDDQRSDLMPINKKYPLADVLEVLDDHVKMTGRKVYIAYVLLPGVNDSADHAQQLISILKKRAHLKQLYHLNLIRYNPALGVPDDYKRPDEQRLRLFYQQIKQAGFKATIRQSFGVEIDAACGQLYGQYKANKLDSGNLQP